MHPSDHAPPSPPNRITRFVETPNPGAIKCLLARAPSPGPGGTRPRSYDSPDAAVQDPLARRVLGVPGVTHVLVGPGWLSVGKAPGAHWEDLKPALQLAVEQAG